MGKLTYSIFVASALAVYPLAAANAAGLTPEPVPVPAPVPIPECCSGGKYMKVFMGITNQEVDDISSDVIQAGQFDILQKGFDSSPFIGIGVGYQKNNWLRFDVTAEYRGKASFNGLDRYFDDTGPCPTNFCTNEYTGDKSEWLGLFNIYADFGDWKGIKAFVGAGLGFSAITFDNFRDTNIITGSVFHANEQTEWDLAWALHAGFTYALSHDLTLEMSYRYTHLGDGDSGRLVAFDGSGSIDGIAFEDLTSHDVMLGLRWKFAHGCCEPASYEPPYK